MRFDRTFGVIEPKGEPAPGAELAGIAKSPASAFYEDTDDDQGPEDRGTEYCDNPEHHEYELYVAVEDIDHSRTKTKSLQTNGIVERLHKTMLNEFYRIAFRKKLYTSIKELQDDLDDWIRSYNEERPHC